MSQPSWIGNTLGGRYKIEALLGQGGMAAVYKATDPNLRRTVAVKLIHSHLAEDSEFVRRFEEEAAAVARLRHPNIVQVFDFNHDGNVYYMVLEFVPGETLQARLKALNAAGQRLPLSETLQIMATVCEAVAYAHQRDMIHRDLKPANVILSLQGQPILMDFGIAKILGGTQHTATGAIVGTAVYMSPEQVQGDSLDQRADIYSLGVMLFEMATGRPPFEGDSAMTIMLKHVNEPVPDLRRSPGNVPERLVAVIEKALAKNPADRFQTAGEMAAALRAAAQTTVRADTARAALKPEPDRTILETPATDSKPAASPSTASGRPAFAAVAPSLPTSVQPAPVAPKTNAKTPGKTIPEKKRGAPLGVLIALAVLGLVCVIGVVGASLLAASGGLGGINKGNATSTKRSVVSTATSAPPVTASAIATVPSTLEPTATAIPIPPGMALVPAGTFNMGAADGAADEAPVHPVTLDAFFIDQHEVTNARYQKCVEAGACAAPASSRSSTHAAYYGSAEFADFPVIQVNWNQAAAFCVWDQGKRLPTEAEWEYAARGSDGRRFPWGNDFDPSLLPAQESDTVAVGKYPGGVSPFGVYDLAGNVVEWVADWYGRGYYTHAESRNPTGPKTGTLRVLRGGSFGNPDGSFYTATQRYKELPTFRDTDIGFRCASSESTSQV